MSKKSVFKNMTILALIFVGIFGLLLQMEILTLPQVPQFKPSAHQQEIDEGAEDAPVISKETELWLVKEYACGEEERVPLEPDQRLIGLSLEELKKTFDGESGWAMEETEQGALAFRQTSSDLCQEHRQLRFIRLVGKGLAIYEGSYEKPGALIEKISIEKELLPVELQVILDQSRSYENLTEKLKQDIREVLEFENDSEVNYFLDTLDEYLAE